MKTLISFVGNIASGKTTISELLAKKTRLSLFSIDAYRIKHKAHDITKEWAAWDDLIAEIQKPDIAILESSGLSAQVKRIYRLFDKVIVILLDCPPHICLDRLQQRTLEGYKPVPYCYHNMFETDSEKISAFHSKLYLLKPNKIYSSLDLEPAAIVNAIKKTFNL